MCILLSMINLYYNDRMQRKGITYVQIIYLFIRRTWSAQHIAMLLIMRNLKHYFIFCPWIIHTFLIKIKKSFMKNTFSVIIPCELWKKKRNSSTCYFMYAVLSPLFFIFARIHLIYTRYVYDMIWPTLYTIL